MTANKKKNKNAKRPGNRAGRGPAGPAGHRPTASRATMRRPENLRSDRITLAASVIELLRLVWEIGQKLGW